MADIRIKSNYRNGRGSATVTGSADVIDTEQGGLSWFATSFTGSGALETSDNQTDWNEVTASAGEPIQPLDVLQRFVRLTEAGTVYFRNL